jgi:soluble P-type ATPase
MDIVKRLRKRAATWVSVGWGNNDIFDEAADEIERLRNKVRWLEMCENTVVKQDNEIERLRGENQKQRERIMLLNSMIQTEHEIIRVAALKESE